MRQQKGRAHLVHELLIDDPAAWILEALGFDQDLIARGCCGMIRRYSDTCRYQDA
jgi:hypothetical protein